MDRLVVRLGWERRDRVGGRVADEQWRVKMLRDSKETEECAR
jgi:hypothetical protein